jgi:hypothetical protein
MPAFVYRCICVLMSWLSQEAALGPMRSLMMDIRSVAANQVRAISFVDFEKALMQVRASVSTKDLTLYIDWNRQFGSTEIQGEDLM